MRIAFLLTVMILAVMFAVQNAEVVSLDVFFWTLNASLAVIIVLCFAVGALLTALAMAPGMYRSRSGARRLQARVTELENTARPDDPAHARTSGSVQPFDKHSGLGL